jgi:SAM-dependent methyltransferase
MLEVGCGQGALLQKLAREFPASLVHGADVSEESLARARARCPQATLFQLDIDSPYFDEQATPWLGAFDLVVASEVLEHLGNDRKALERLSRLLAPNGKLIVSVPAGERTRFDHAIGHLRHYTEAQLAEKLCEAGFRVERVFAWGFPFHSFYRFGVKWAARATLRIDGSPRKPSGAAPNGFLSAAYRFVSLGLTPLYLFNSSRCGPQLFAAARKE